MDLQKSVVNYFSKKTDYWHWSYIRFRSEISIVLFTFSMKHPIDHNLDLKDILNVNNYLKFYNKKKLSRLYVRQEQWKLYQTSKLKKSKNIFFLVFLASLKKMLPKWKLSFYMYLIVYCQKWPKISKKFWWMF